MSYPTGIIIITILFLLHFVIRPRSYVRIISKITKPISYDLSDFPEMQDFHNNFAAIRAECLAVINEPLNNIQRKREAWHNSVDPTAADEFFKKTEGMKGWFRAWAPGSSSANINWLNFPFLAVKHRFEKNIALCPTMSKLLDKHQSRINICGFSMLKPGAELKEHVDTTGIQYNTLAYHLGLVVPADGENNLIVNGKKFIQKEGQSIIFESTYPHSAANTSKEMRIILYMDFDC